MESLSIENFETSYQPFTALLNILKWLRPETVFNITYLLVIVIPLCYILLSFQNLS